MSEWQPIETAPKDGTKVKLGWKDPEDKEMQEWYVMQWGHIQKNGFYPGKTGMWMTPCGSMTWNGTPDEGGPTHWQEETCGNT